MICLAFEEAQAATAARLFNAAGRARPLRVDAMVAACAIEAGCRSATSNRSDFNRFTSCGLVLV
jgi:predicted nucleic acid-binding protein